MSLRDRDIAARAAATRARLGMPDRREHRDPWAVNGHRWWPSTPGAPTVLDLVQELELRAAVDEGEELSLGVAIVGAPGTCTACDHWKVWHAHARYACELCPCQAFVRAVAA